MCKLCSVDPIEVQAAQKTALDMAEKLERAAGIYRGLSDGTIKPHSYKFRMQAQVFKTIIRYLVKEYV